MKNVTVILMSLSLFVMMSFKGGDDKKKEDIGIDFFHGTLTEAKVLAAEQNKLIFMDAYTTWCGPCKMMARKSFTNEKVGDLFNDKYISVKIDMEKGEGRMLSKKYGVRAYPSIFILDSDGKILERAVGYHDPKDLLRFGKRE